MTQRAGQEQYISPSRLKLWLKCPLAFKLRYVDGIVTPTPPNLFLGRMVHAGLEHYYRYRAREITLYPEVVAGRIKSMWKKKREEEAVTFSSLDEEQTLKAKACDLVTTYLRQVPKHEPIPLAIENRLEAPLIDPQTGKMLGTLLGIMCPSGKRAKP